MQYLFTGLCMGVICAPTMAQSAANQKKAQNIFNEYKAMEIAKNTHKKCGGLDALTFKAAQLTGKIRHDALINMKAATTAQLSTTAANISKSINGTSCENLKKDNNLKISNERAVFYKNFYLYIWHEYREIAAARTIFSKEALSGGEEKYRCGKYSFKQMGYIKPFTDAAYAALKNKGQYQNARREAKNMINSCKMPNNDVASSPLMQMLEAAMAHLPQKG